MTDEQINEIVLINKIIEKCYLKALSHDTDINSKHELRQIAKWLGEIEKNWERIDRQNAEIERLKKELDWQKSVNKELREDVENLNEKFHNQFKTQKSEARKEFAEKIEQVLELENPKEYDYVCKLLKTLLKEME